MGNFSRVPKKLRVVGVMGPDIFPAEVDVFVPLSRLHPGEARPRNYHELRVIARLRPGQTIDEAQREIATLSADLERSYPSTNAGIGAYILPLRDEIIGNVREPLLILLSASGLLLLIACGNSASILLVRAGARQKELAVRMAFGASPYRIIAQFVTECLILSAEGAAAGLLLAFSVMPLIHSLGEGCIPRVQNVMIDTRVPLYTAGVAVLTGVLIALLPALNYSLSDLNQMLRSMGQTATRSYPGKQFINFLIAQEVSLALVVVVGINLVVSSSIQIFRGDFGFRADHVFMAEVSLPSTHYNPAGVYTFYTRLLAKTAAIPGVVSVSTTTALPFGSTVPRTRLAVGGIRPPKGGEYPLSALVFVSSDFFKTLEIPVLRGRTFTPEELRDRDYTRCIPSAMLTKLFWGEQDPVGRVILTDPEARTRAPCQVIGVAGDSRLSGLVGPLQPVVYFPSYLANDTLVVRTSSDPMEVAEMVQRETNAIDPEIALYNILSMTDALSRSLSGKRLLAALLVVFSSIGLTLAALGLFGVLSYSVAQRVQETGVRMAIGAARGDIFRLFLKQGPLLALIGLVIGTPAAVVVSNLLFRIQTDDPRTFGEGCLLVLAFSAVCSFFPAWRATRTNPAVSLLGE
jgi:predicted permease